MIHGSQYSATNNKRSCKQADERAAAPAKSKRAFPERKGVPQAETLPAVLLERRAALEDGQKQKPRRIPADDDFIDFRMHAERDVTFISAWTKNAGHEAERYVFGADGTGSGKRRIRGRCGARAADGVQALLKRHSPAHVSRAPRRS